MSNCFLKNCCFWLENGKKIFLQRQSSAWAAQNKSRLHTEYSWQIETRSEMFVWSQRGASFSKVSQTRRVFGDAVLLAGNGFFLDMRRSSRMDFSWKWHKNVIFRNFYWYCDRWANLWPLQKIKISRVLFYRNFFTLEKARLGAAVQNDSKIAVPPPPTKNIVFGMGWTWVAGSTWDFSDAKHSSHKLWKFDAFFSGGIQKILLQDFGRAILDQRPKSHFLGKKILENFTRLSFLFLQRPEVRPNIMETTKNVKNDVPSPCAIQFVYLIFERL